MIPSPPGLAVGRARRPASQRLAAGGVLGAGLATVALASGGRLAALFAVGAMLGFVLYHSSFGFTAAWRALLVQGRGDGLRAQMLMLAATVLLFFPALAAGTLFGRPVAGLVAPAGTSVVVGAFLFGVGMQLGGGCGSGTLYTVGGGSTRMLITLVAFVAGSTLGAAHLAWWAALPSLPPVSLIAAFGLWPALGGNLAVFAAVAGLSAWIERRRHGRLAGRPSGEGHALARLAAGPWPLAAGALGLALLNFATLAIAGRPWGITSAFALWGSKLVAATGLADPARWPFWADDPSLRQGVLADITSVMDLGIIAGALAAAAMAAKLRFDARVPARSAAAAVLGGLLLGYGARLAFGCNIGAFFSGIASGSLHGWLWIACAIAGNAAGVRLRPSFGLAVDDGVPRVFDRAPTCAEA